MGILYFKVDAELLRELGERLVGKPHVALAELIKNSYDADATEVKIKFLPDEDKIEIHDNGHGMTIEEFEDFWMRIGTTHKKEKKHSEKLGRNLTGSKGVGRLSVQFLAKMLTIITVPEDESQKWLKININWEKILKVDEVREVKVTYQDYDRKSFAVPFQHGTLIILRNIRNEWDENAIKDLASEIWWLQPHFGSLPSSNGSKDKFDIQFQSSLPDYTNRFVKQMYAIKRIWIAKIVGESLYGKVNISLMFPNGERINHNYDISDFDHNDRQQFDTTKNLNYCRFEIHIYNLRGKQKFGIKVAEARDYFERNGGIHVYDGGFRLPYYGLAESDWLKLEYDHSHRKNVSKLLSKDILQEPRALHNLPTLGRVLGTVNVNTSTEPNLKIMITRDRLEKTVAFDDLVCTVRYAMDWYANEITKIRNKEKEREKSTEPTSMKFEHVEQVLEAYESDIPKDIYADVYNKIQEAMTAAKSDQEIALERMGMLAPLATAGISALSYQHELKKQFAYIEDTIEKIQMFKVIDSELKADLNSLSKELATWLKRARSTNLLFDYIGDADNIQMRDRRLRAKRVIEEITNQTRFLARDTVVDYSQIDGNLRLPKASFAEWGAIFQNVFINAFTAMLDSSKRLIKISNSSHGKTRKILIQDTGHGINLKDADKFFEPFQRASRISAERKALGYGGTGLGLTIVRLLANNIGCRVQFVNPDDGFSTAFSIQWREEK